MYIGVDTTSSRLSELYYTELLEERRKRLCNYLGIPEFSRNSGVFEEFRGSLKITEPFNNYMALKDPLLTLLSSSPGLYQGSPELVLNHDYFPRPGLGEGQVDNQ